MYVHAEAWPFQEGRGAAAVWRETPARAWSEEVKGKHLGGVRAAFTLGNGLEHASTQTEVAMGRRFIHAAMHCRDGDFVSFHRFHAHRK